MDASVLWSLGIRKGAGRKEGLFSFRTNSEHFTSFLRVPWRHLLYIRSFASRNFVFFQTMERQSFEEIAARCRVENRHLDNAARKIIQAANELSISDSTKDTIVKLVKWIASKSRDNLDNTLTEFLSCQLCRLLDFVDSLLRSGAPRVEQNRGSHENLTSERDFSSFRRSVLLEAEAEGVPAGEPCQEGAPQRSSRVQLSEEDRPDVMIDIPDLSTDHLTLDISDLRLNLALETRIANDLVVLRPAVQCTVGKCEVSIDGLRANALAVVRLDNIRKIVESSLDSVAQNPDILGRSSNTAADYAIPGRFDENAAEPWEREEVEEEEDRVEGKEGDRVESREEDREVHGTNPGNASGGNGLPELGPIEIPFT